jgi:hypothetical protein
MDRADLKELHYITPIANLASIVEHGILSHRRTDALKHTSVAMQEVQDIRAKKTVPGGRPLHEYANLYINGRNPMLYVRLGQVGEIVVLRVTPDVLDLAKVVVTDRNAASTWVRFAPASSGLAIVDESYTFADYWTHPEDPIEQWRHKSMMCAEVLVPDVVPTSYINGAYAVTLDVADGVRKSASWLDVVVNKKLYFR